MNISSIKTNSADSPKTPGGISKSLLTPCRRVGLSRKWKKSGVSPFISPLGSSSSNKEVNKGNEIRKRKKCDAEVEEKEIGEDSSEEKSSETNCNISKTEIDRTPTRTLLPRKKSKTLATALKSQEVEKEPQSISVLSDNILLNEETLQKDSTKQLSENPYLITNDENMHDESIDHSQSIQMTKVSNLSRKNSKTSNKIKIVKSPVKTTNEPLTINSDGSKKPKKDKNEILINTDSNKVSRKSSPNNLTKECMVVIQKKIFKTDKVINNTPKNNMKENLTINRSESQSLLDSDSDDVPLSDLNKPNTTINVLQQKTQIQNIDENLAVKNNQKLKGMNDNMEQKSQNLIDNKNIIEAQTPQNVIDLTSKESNDNDFVEAKKANIKKLEKTTSTTGLKIKGKEKHKASKLQMKAIPKTSPQSLNLCDEDDDFDYNRSRTILIKKTYDKVAKPSRAKSTGSITQNDLDEITARIESKKNLFLAKAMTDETKELRELIKKWQIGCQTALTELLELMRRKLPDQNMAHSELLQMLKIPPDMVGYDSDSESFTTPDDAAIILSALKLN